MQTAGMKPAACNVLKWVLFGIGCAYTLLYLVPYLLSVINDNILILLIGLPVPFALDFIIAAWWFSAQKSGWTGFVVMAVADLVALASIALSLYCIVMFSMSWTYPASIYGLIVSGMQFLFSAAEIVIMALLQADRFKKSRAGVYDTRPDVRRNVVISCIWVVLSAALVVVWALEAYFGLGSYRPVAVYFIPTFLLCVVIMAAWWFAPWRSRGAAVFMTVIVMIMGVILLVSGICEGFVVHLGSSIAVLYVSIAWFVMLCVLAAHTISKLRRMRKAAKMGREHRKESQAGSQ